MFITAVGMALGIAFADNSRADTIFRDTFFDTDVSDPKREPVRWFGDGARPFVEDGSLQVQSLRDDGFARAEVARIRVDNVSVRTQARSIHGAPYVQLRLTRNIADSGYVSYIAPDGTASISISGTNFRDILHAETDFRPEEEDVLMQFDAFGSELSLYLWRPGEVFPAGDPILSVNDDTVAGPGSILLGVGLLQPETVSAGFRFVHAADTPLVDTSIVGDFNINGLLDTGDIDELTSESAAGLNLVPYDLDGDSLVNDSDINVWVKDLFGSWIGDANLDKQFNSTDLVSILASGRYEGDVASVWSTGDFNGDGHTDSGDLIAALAEGGYEVGPRAAIAAVPEPSSLLTQLMSAMSLAPLLRRLRH